MLPFAPTVLRRRRAARLAAAVLRAASAWRASSSPSVVALLAWLALASMPTLTHVPEVAFHSTRSLSRRSSRFFRSCSACALAARSRSACSRRRRAITPFSRSLSCFQRERIRWSRKLRVDRKYLEGMLTLESSGRETLPTTRRTIAAKGRRRKKSRNKGERVSGADDFFLPPPLVGRVTTEEPGMCGVRIKRLDAALRGGEEPQRPKAD